MMSQVSGPSMGEESQVDNAVTKGSLPKPPRYPSFSFRRAASRSSSGMKQEVEAATTRTRSEPTMSESHDVSEVVNGGKLFHVRVTLGYLKAIQKTEKLKATPSHGSDTSLVTTAFASLDPQVSRDHNFSHSLPLNPAEINNVVWPKQSSRRDDGTNGTNRRLYFSTVLHREEEDADLKNVLMREDDMSTVTGTWNQEETESYSPELIKIQLGVARGKDLLHLGVATLIVDGNEVIAKQIDLPVRSLLPGEDDSSPKSNSPKRSRVLKRLFGKKVKRRSSFTADEYNYSFTPNAILRIRLDVLGHETPLPARSIMKGPAVWGDGAEDDNDSFASILVVDMSSTEATPREEKDEIHQGDEVASAIAAPESIEVVNDPTTGPSILSEPPMYAEPDAVDIASTPAQLPMTSLDIGPQNGCLPGNGYKESPSSILQLPGMFCGFSDAFAPQAIEVEPSQSLDFEDSSTIATSLYKGTKEEAWKRAAKKKRAISVHSTTSSGILRNKSLSTVDETADNTSHYCDDSRSSGRRSAALRGRRMDALSIGEDTVESLNEAKRSLQHYAKRTGIAYEEMLEHLDVASSPSALVSLESSIGEDTIDSIFEAKELLQRYADRVGVDIEDLLAAEVLNWDNSVEGSTGTSRTSRSADGTEGTGTTKSSRSRFSLFVDD